MTILQISNKDLLKTYKFIRYKNAPAEYKLKLLDFIRIKFIKHLMPVLVKYKLLSKIYDIIDSFKTNFQKYNYKCAICLDFNNKPIYLYCGHYFHEKCILNWLDLNNNNCPVCRKNILPI